jgi:hypothetical protein
MMKNLAGNLMLRHSRRLQDKWAALVVVASVVAIASSLVVAPSSPVAAQEAETQLGGKFTQMGMHIPQAKDGVWPDVPIGSIRLWDTGVSWREINTAPGVYDWSTLDQVVDLANSKGAAVLYVFGNTPAWAAEPKCLAEQGGAIKGAGANCPPADLKTFSTFAGEIAKKYGTDIESYELWNEGNIGTFWDGSVQQLFDMTNEGAKAIKSANPKALIASVSVTTRLESTFINFLPEYANLLKGANWPIDAFAIHSYPAGSFEECIYKVKTAFGVFLECNPSTAGVGFDYLASREWNTAMRHLLTRSTAIQRVQTALKYTYLMPNKIEIWDTELNYGLAGPGTTPAQAFSEDVQALLINASYVDSKKLDVERTYWFAWGPKDQAGIVQFGVTADFNSKPAQAFEKYWRWIEADLLRSWLVEFYVVNPNNKDLESVVTKSFIPRAFVPTYNLQNPGAGVTYSFATGAFISPAVGPCIQLKPSEAIEALTLGRYPFMFSRQAFQGC